LFPLIFHFITLSPKSIAREFRLIDKSKRSDVASFTDEDIEQLLSLCPLKVIEAGVWYCPPYDFGTVTRVLPNTKMEYSTRVFRILMACMRLV
jgi:hypothetical protein